MNTRAEYQSRSLMRLNQQRLSGALALLLLLPVAAWAGGVVTNCTEAALRAAMIGGGMVTFACDGTITLANTIMVTTNSVLDAVGHQITISGGNAVAVFCVTAGVAFSPANLAITHGRGGILNAAGGLVNATNCVFSGNCASGAPGANGLAGGSGFGGALDNSGTLTADLCLFIGNAALGADGLSPSAGQYGQAGGTGGDGQGGAIWNIGTMTISRSTFTNNSAVGGTGADGADGRYDFGGPGGAAGSGGAGNGGAIYNLGTLQVVNTTFAANVGAGASGGRGGSGGFAMNGVPSGGSGGSGGAGGTGTGAMFNLGSVELVNCTFAFNSGSGGNGGEGGPGGAGLSYGKGGPGGSGGSGFGSISGLSSLCGLTNCTFGFDQGTPGIGATGDPYGSFGVSSGISAAGAGVVNTLLADTGGNCSGSLTDLGHNLSSDSSCGFTSIGSVNNTDPMLGPLANNGGPTLTMALLPGSPAIDAGNTSLAPPTDQRGFLRPVGPAADIGAFEYQFVLPSVATLPATQFTGTNATLNGTVNPNGCLTAAWFDWGTTTNYGNATATTSLGSGTNDLPLSVPVSGLTPGITYHFRVAASNSTTAVHGRDMSFTTIAPPEVTTLSASEVTPTSAMFNGLVNPNGFSTAAWFQWGTTTNYGNLTTATSTGSGNGGLALSVLVGGLTAGARYHFCVAASNSNATVYGSDQSFSTADWTGTSGVVTNGTEAALRAAMSGGGKVTFACDGLITLSSTVMIAANTLLDAGGHQVTLSGGNAVGVFYVNTNVALSLANLTMANGQATNGAGILNAGGSVAATNCLFSGNCATNSGGSARGGAIENLGGAVCLFGCVFTANSAYGTTSSSGLSGGSGWGGALDNSGTLTADLCGFVANSAIGGAVQGQSYSGGWGGDGAGGAICNLGSLTIGRSTFTNNTAAGGAGGPGAFGGGDAYQGGPGGYGGSGGAGKGGAIYNAGTANVVSTTFAFNSGLGGNGGGGGPGGFGAYGYGGPGGNGGTGGDGVGAVFNSGDLEVINSTFASNSSSAGDGGAGGVGGPGENHSGQGGNGGWGGSGFGAIYDQSRCRITNGTLVWNSAAGGGAGGSGLGSPNGASGEAGSGCGGITSGSLVNTLLAGNAPSNNCGGYITDLGHNLSSDTSCAFTAVGSMNNTDPKLGPLANNGGPTLTMALLPGSPAIDAGNTSLAPATDQRGFPRPAGLAADIGAFEYGSVMPTLAISQSSLTGLNILASGNANQPCRLLSSTDMLNWVPIASSPIGGGGTIQFIVNCAPGGACRFYRLVMP